MTPFELQNTTSKIFLEELYSSSDVYIYPYARYAFLEALKKLKIKSIYLPAFICRDMLSPINYLHIDCYFYDCNESVEPILEDIKCDAILMVNYFGFSQNIEPFEKYKRKYNAILIEDNAHGFLSKDIFGNMLGTRGDVGLLSIRKTVFLPNGGALLINSESLKSKCFESAIMQLSEEDSRYQTKLNLKKKIFHRYVGIMILLLRRLIRRIKTGSEIPLPDKKSESELPNNQYVTPMLTGSSVDIDILYETERRKRLYIKISEWAKLYGISPLNEFYENSIPFEFAFIDNNTSKDFEKFLFKKGFFILPWPDLPDEIIKKCPEFYKKIKVVPFLW